MKKLLQSFLLVAACCLLPTAHCFGQAPVTNPLIRTQEIDFYSSPLPPVSLMSASISGTAGVTQYFYWIVATFPAGNATPAGPISVPNAPNTLSGSNFVVLNWITVPGATSYDVLRTTTPNLPSGAATIAVSTGVTTGTLNDQGAALSSYTISTFSPGIVANFTYQPFTAIPILTFQSGAVGGGVVCTSTTPVTVNANVTTDQNLMTCALGARALNSAGRTLRLFAAGVYTTQAAQTPTITLKVKVGAVTLASWTSPPLTASASNMPWIVSFVGTAVATGTSGTMEPHGSFQVTGGTVPGASSAIISDTNTAVSSAIDFTAAQTVQLTVAFSTNAATANIGTERLIAGEVLN